MQLVGAGGAGVSRRLLQQPPSGCSPRLDFSAIGSTP
jgi:hypothetical protein